MFSDEHCTGTQNTHLSSKKNFFFENRAIYEILTYLLHSPSWEANWFASSQEIPLISPNPKVHYRTQKRPPEESSRMWVFLNRNVLREGLLATRPNPKLKDHPFSAVSDCLFNLFAATHHIGDHFSIRNLRTRHAVVTGTQFMGLLWGNVKKCCWVGQTTDDNMVHARSMLDTYGYKYTHTSSNTHCFPL